MSTGQWQLVWCRSSKLDFDYCDWIGKFPFSRLPSPKWRAIRDDEPATKPVASSLLFSFDSLGVNVWSQFPVERSPLIYRFYVLPAGPHGKKKEITAISVCTCSPWHRLFWSDGSRFGVARERVNNRIRGHTHAPCSLTHTHTHATLLRHTAYRTRESIKGLRSAPLVGRGARPKSIRRESRERNHSGPAPKMGVDHLREREKRPTSSDWLISNSDEVCKLRCCLVDDDRHIPFAILAPKNPSAVFLLPCLYKR